MNKTYSVIGTMSGTSLDGLDMACVNFSMGRGAPKYEILDAATLPYDDAMLALVKDAITALPGSDLSDIDRRLGMWMGEKIRDFILKCRTKPLFISSHGQTVAHRPNEGITLQLGDGRIIAEQTGLPVISNFRQQDIDLGGQGAPLVPVGDLFLFSNFEYCLNLGGIANISHNTGQTISAWDICICNSAANHFANMLGLVYDDGGKAGMKGKIIPDLLERWNALDYFKMKAPKSLDTSFFRYEMLDCLTGLPVMLAEDLLRTLYEHIGIQIASSVSKKDKRILLTGGGAHNKFLLSLLTDKYGLLVEVPSDKVIDFKEALVFAFLGLLRWLGEDNVLSSVTGASRNHSSGSIFHPGS